MDENNIIIYLREDDEFIKLGQALKLAGVVGSGVEAKMLILDGEVSVNGEVETRRGKKIFPGDVIGFEDVEIRVFSNEDE